MEVDSLDELKAAFRKWRGSKRHAREAMPEELLARARRAAEMHGVKAVVGVTRVERSRLYRKRTLPARTKGQQATSARPKDLPVPAFSRLELSAPAAPSPRVRHHPIAEVETPTGMRLRVFEPTPEMMGLLSAVCGLGGA